VLERQHRRRVSAPGRRVAHDVAAARRELPEDETPEAVRGAAPDLLAAPALEDEGAPRRGPRHRYEPDPTLDGQISPGRGRREQHGEAGEDKAGPWGPHRRGCTRGVRSLSTERHHAVPWPVRTVVQRLRPVAAPG